MMRPGRTAAGIERLSALLARAAGVALLAMMLVVCYGVVMRYALRSPVAWANEFARFSFLPVVALALAYALRQGAHVVADVFAGALPAGLRRRLQAASGALFLAYAAVSCWAGWRLASTAWAKGLRSDEAEIPLALVQAVIPIGFVALGLQALVEIRKVVPGHPGRERPAGHGDAR